MIWHVDLTSQQYPEGPNATPARTYRVCRDSTTLLMACKEPVSEGGPEPSALEGTSSWSRLHHHWLRRHLTYGIMLSAVGTKALARLLLAQEVY
jgi:hypothetical protein